MFKPRWPQHPEFVDSGKGERGKPVGVDPKKQWSWGSGRLVVGDTASGHWKRHWFYVRNSFVD